MNHKLTFVIPTYNRLDFLKRSVSRILVFIEQAAKAGYIANLFILNNGSKDGTKEWLDVHCSNNKYIKYISHDINHDYAVSFYLALNYGSINSDWVWYHGDDDILGDTLLPIDVFSKIHLAEFSKISLIVCSDTFNEKYKECNIAPVRDVCCSNGFINTLGFMTSLLFKPKSVLNCYLKFDNASFWKTAFVHSFAIFDAFNEQSLLMWNWPVIRTQDERSEAEQQAAFASNKVHERFLILPESIFFMCKALNFKPKDNFLRMHTWTLTAFFMKVFIGYIQKTKLYPEGDLLKQAMLLERLSLGTNSEAEMANNIIISRAIHINNILPIGVFPLEIVKYDPTLILPNNI